ncbi:hypothetical protein CH92_18220 [Stutzerimonas stutzeri]|uniref:Uncharacterized protein n=1 Tax=Stutzerimonas stutzeri TaxID=316 RepID=W8RZV1_STUST|nr:hypothetical protein CH92_18220 [Stutzerimonas stutzeri]
MAAVRLFFSMKSMSEVNGLTIRPSCLRAPVRIACFAERIEGRRLYRCRGPLIEVTDAPFEKP